MIRRFLALGIAAGADHALPRAGRLAAPTATPRRAAFASTTAAVAQSSLDLSAVTTHTLFTLEKPESRRRRSAQHAAREEHAHAAGIGVVDVIRTGERPNGTLRVVIELKSAATSRGEWQPAFADVSDRFVVAVGNKSFVAARSERTGAQRRAMSPRQPQCCFRRAGNRAETGASLAHAPTDSDRDVVVAIDAGHGGQDPGAIGRNGTRRRTSCSPSRARWPSASMPSPACAPCSRATMTTSSCLRERMRARARREGGHLRLRARGCDPRSQHQPAHRCTCSPSAAPAAKRRAGSPSARTRRTSWAACRSTTRTARSPPCCSIFRRPRTSAPA